MYKGPTFAKHICTVLLLTHIISNDFNDKIMSIKHCTCNIGERNSMNKMFMVIKLKINAI